MSVKKIIAVGDVRGQFNDVFNRISTIHSKHGPFTAVFCVGNFFGDDASQLQPYIDGTKTIAVPTYFIVSDDKDTTHINTIASEGGTLCKNLTFLGRFGKCCISGINIVYLSGIYHGQLFSKKPTEIRSYLAKKEIQSNANSNATVASVDIDVTTTNDDENETKESDSDMQSLKSTRAARNFRQYYSTFDLKKLDFSRTDLLLTAEWGRGFYFAVAHGLDTMTSTIVSQFSDVSVVGSPVVAKLAVKVAPQYHFGGRCDLFCNLQPYKNSHSSNVTRFIALGATNSNNKARNIYAANLVPLASLSDEKYASMVDSHPPTTTVCPYTLPFKKMGVKRSRNEANVAKQSNASDSDESSNKRRKLNPKLSTDANGDSVGDDGQPLKRVILKKRMAQNAEGTADGRGDAPNAPHNYRWDTTRGPAGPPPPNYVCYKCGVPGHYIQECPQYAKNGPGNNTNQKSGNDGTMPSGNRDDYFFEKFGGRRAMRRAKKSGGECWFCLGSSKVESHMVVAVGEHTYLALAKGPLTDDHLLIVPIQHLPHSMKFTAGVRREIALFLACLAKCYETQSKSLLICDRNLPTKYSPHGYLEIMAVDTSVATTDLEKTLTAEATKEGIEFQNVSKDANLGSFVGSFGYMVLHNHASGEKWVHSVQSIMKKIPLNFLRRVIAVHLETPEKAEWTACIQEAADETTLTNRLKDKFRPYDWTQRNKSTQNKKYDS